MLDVIVVGGGPAGLSAALTLGRARRSTLVLDSRDYRNAPSPAAHNLLTRDGTPPGELRRIAREQLQAYPSVEIREIAADDAVPLPAGGFEVRLADGSTVAARRLLLATGLADELPRIAGLDRLWGRGAYHCPYCHGYELRDTPIAVLGGTPDRVELALHLRRFSDDVVVCTDGPPAFDEAAMRLLEGNGVAVATQRVARLHGRRRPGERRVRRRIRPGEEGDLRQVGHAAALPAARAPRLRAARRRHGRGQRVLPDQRRRRVRRGRHGPARHVPGPGRRDRRGRGERHDRGDRDRQRAAVDGHEAARAARGRAELTGGPQRSLFRHDLRRDHRQRRGPPDRARGPRLGGAVARRAAVRARPDRGRHRPARDRRRRRRPRLDRLGRHRLPARLHRDRRPVRAGERPVRAAGDVPGRGGPVHRGERAVRPGRRPRSAHRLPGAAGDRRGRAVRAALDRAVRAVPGRPARQGAGLPGWDLRPRQRRRAARRRPAHRPAGLALDLLHQRPARRARRTAHRDDAAPARRGAPAPPRPARLRARRRRRHRPDARGRVGRARVRLGARRRS